MPRVRADDYDAKTQSILDSAASLFAKVGYPNAKMQDIAKACGASKSMLYHYFPAKDDLLFAMLEEHLENLIANIEEIAAQPGPAAQRFGNFVQAYAQKSAQSRRRHLSAMNDLKFLPKNLQAPLLQLETRVTGLVADMLRELNPKLPDDAYKPYTMLLVGMLNWTDTWYKPGGTMKPQELCERISRLFLTGFLAEKA
ncbi:TetR/AcrR family transcriptional regulator [Variovorax ginsengisoli]|uniref:AcrR family transcriptional regulator n=1 Tax=Variovorax ginsengisoli TaxID=363844 RepID=A0ABT9S9G0_9BURK|nr:TetR/AcrR family transcriptional regulator [Variovorax ginsengisoli]MDP9900998.1 AcrR family transcriptional regulator [Variovorax ginsengisoli]